MTEGPVPPGYGPPPGYGSPPRYEQPPGYGGYGPPPAPKPGIIPLRPLGVGEILDGAFAAIRWNPKATLIPSAIVSAISGVAIAAATYVIQRDLSTTLNLSKQAQLTTSQVSQFGTSVASLYGVIAFVTFFADILLTGVLTTVVGQAVLGQKETVGSAWRTARSRVFPLIGAVLLAGLMIFIGWAAAIAASVGIGILLGAGAHLVALGVLAGVVCGIAATVVAIVVGIRWSLTTPVLVLERARPIASLRRSWRLVRSSAWRVFGILLLTELIVGFAGVLLRLPFALAGGASALTNPTAAPTVTGAIVSAIGTIIAGTITTPVFAGVVVLMYTDLRMRREGMDIALRASAAAPGDPS